MKKLSSITIHNTDVIEFLKNYNGSKFHAVISDPPYGLAFMGKAWDKFTPKQYQEWVTEWSSLLLDHLYPGAVCMFFGGTRTYHRLATGLEDAGFEVFDSMMWCYGSGFPKSYNISKGIDSKGGKSYSWFADYLRKIRIEKGLTQSDLSKYFPSKTGNLTGCVCNWELGYNTPTPEQFNKLVEVLELPFENMESLERDIIETKIDSGNRQITILGDKEREYNITKPNHELAHQYNGYGTALKPAYEPIVLCRKPRGKETFVDCALNYGTGALNVDGTRIQTDDDLSGGGYSENYNGSSFLAYGGKLEYKQPLGRFPANLGLICDCECEPCECDYQTIGDSARFFYTAKSSRKERNLGLEHLPDSIDGGLQGTQDLSVLTGSGNIRNNVMKNNHPTVKPIKLIEYLATMLLPPIENSSILIPFSGSGSEVIGAMLAKWNIITSLEIDENYCNIQQNRIDYWKQYETYELAMKGK